MALWTPMRTVVPAALISVFSATAAAAQGAWCAEGMVSQNCGYYTLEQCRAAAAGQGSACHPNPFVTTAPVAAPKRSKRRTPAR
jgi:Protein of unknown function (DUF3551)